MAWDVQPEEVAQPAAFYSDFANSGVFTFSATPTEVGQYVWTVLYNQVEVHCKSCSFSVSEAALSLPASVLTLLDSNAAHDYGNVEAKLLNNLANPVLRKFKLRDAFGNPLLPDSTTYALTADIPDPAATPILAQLSFAALVTGTHEYLLTPDAAFYALPQAEYTLRVYATAPDGGFAETVLVHSAPQAAVDESKVVSPPP